MINEAMRRLVSESSGAEAWTEIADRADAPESYAAMSYYDDSVTYALVGAASDVLGTPAPELLRGFGHYWATRVGPENYAEILGATGTDVVSVLVNLDHMHARLQSLYPELRPPSFAVSGEDADTFEVLYSSEREGLAPFVVGLLEGLGDLYGTPATVVHVSAPSSEQSYDVFRLTLER
ncbi:MAG: heme NO-binding domain-containing protein [Candidatus Nanopelagicales bacterium]